MHKPHPQLEKGPLIVAFELLSQLNERTQHEPAAMAFCNELAFHFKCTRVGLAYVRDGLAEMIAISQTTKFERRLESVRDWEFALQEAVDQDEDLVWPAHPDDPVVTREHEGYARRYAIHSLCTLPLRLDQEVRGAVSLIREGHPFTPAEVDALRLMIDLAARRLWDLDRMGTQWWRLPLLQAREKLTLLLGPRYTWVKFTALLLSMAALLMFLLPVPYRVTGDLALKTNTLINLPAPFDGYIKEVRAEPGDNVKQGDLVVALDPTELQLKRDESLANTQRFQSQAQMASGDSDLSQMHVYEAQADQADSQMEQVKYNLAHANITSPLDGVVVEGKLKEKIGSPVKQGDVLLKITRLEDLYIEADVSEEDIQFVQNGESGEARLESRPGEVFPVEVVRVEPAAVAIAKGNFFKVHCALKGTAPSWWRPGMTGVIKIRSGWKTPWFIVTHKLIDFLRLKFWF